MILILGGNGFVGQHLARNLLDRGEAVTVTCHRRAAPPPLIARDIAAGRAHLHPVDITDAHGMMALFDRVRPRVVIDLSGHAPKALSPGQDVEFRISALLNILEGARIFGAARVVLMSSADAYWGLPTEAAPFAEDDPVPLLEQDDHFIVQSWVKKSLEVIGNLYRRQHGMEVVFVRASGIYGPLYRTWLNIPSRLARAAATGARDFGPGVALPFAEGGYDQVHVTDAADGIARVALAPRLSHPVYNIGSGGVPTYGEFAAALARVVPGFAVTLPSRGDAPSTDPMDGRWMDITRAEAELGWRPRMGLDEGMAGWVDWIRRDAAMVHQ